MKSFAFFPIFLATASLSPGAIIIGNLANFTSDTTTGSLITNIAYYPAVAPNPDATPPVAGSAASYGAKAIGFQMSSTYEVTSLTLRLRNVSGGTDSPTVSIYSGTNSPTTLVGTFTNPTFPSNAVSNFVFTPATNITLNAGSSYFIVVQQLNTTGGSDYVFQWMNGEPTITPTGAGATSTVARFNSGTNSAATANTSPSSQFNWYQLEGNLIPEPSTTTIAGIGLLTLALRRRRA